MAKLCRVRTLLALTAATVACAPQPNIPVAAPTGEWIPLFNHRNLEGWTTKIAGLPVNDNYRNTFRVENGLLEVSYQQYDTFGDRFGSLFCAKKLSHYWLRAQYRFVGAHAPGAPGWTYKNSGLQLHSQAPQSMRLDQQFPVSVEFDIVGGRFIGSRPTGNACHYGSRISIRGVPLEELCSTVSDLTIRDDRWVTILAEVEGSKRVRQIVNGALIVEYTNLALDRRNPDAQRLLAAGAEEPLNSGYISIQSNGAPIQFKSIEVLPVPDAPQTWPVQPEK